MKATYFTVTSEFLKYLGVNNLETDNLNALFHMPEGIIITNIFQDWYDFQRSCFKVSVEGDFLPLWAERKEGEMMTPCTPKTTLLEDGKIQWEFIANV